MIVLVLRSKGVGVFIGIYNIDGNYYAMNNICPHLGGVLTYGFFDDNVVTCPLHMWEFDVQTGKCLWPEQEKLPTYPVKIEGNDILVDVNSPQTNPTYPVKIEGNDILVDVNSPQTHQ